MTESKQCKLSRPTMSLLGNRNKTKDAKDALYSSLSPRKDVSNDSAHEIDSIHREEDDE